MITNEQIDALYTASGDEQCGDQERIRRFARALVAEALRVKPLEWEKSEEDSDGYVLTANTPNGFYEILLHEQEVTLAMACEEVHEHDFETVEEAIEAAQKDYASRVLSNLVHGNDVD